MRRSTIHFRRFIKWDGIAYYFVFYIHITNNVSIKNNYIILTKIIIFFRNKKLIEDARVWTTHKQIPHRCQKSGSPRQGLMSLLMKMQQKANQLLLSIIALLTKSYLLCLIVYLLHLIQMKTMLMHGSIGINIRAVMALICFDYQLKTL